MNITDKNLKTVANYAREVDKSLKTIYRWVESGKVKSIKIDGVLFIIVEEDGNN